MVYENGDGRKGMGAMGVVDWWKVVRIYAFRWLCGG